MPSPVAEIQTSRQFVLAYVLRYKNRWLLGFLFVLLTNVWQVGTPWVLRYAIEYLEYQMGGLSSVRLPNWLLRWASMFSLPHFLMLVALISVAVAAIHGLFRYLMRNILIGLSREIEYRIRNDYFNHLQTLPALFYQQAKTGDLMARATNDIEAVRTMMGPGVMYMMNTITLSLFSLTMLMTLSPRVTAWSLLPMPVVAVIVRHQVKKINGLFKNIQAQYSSITAKVQENLSGMRVLKSYVQEAHEIADFKQLNREYIHRNMKLVRVRAGLWSTIDFLLGLTILTCLYLSGREVMQGRLTIGGMVAFMAYLSMLAWPIISLGWVLNMWQEGMASCERILSIMKEKNNIDDDENTDWSITSLKGQVEFDHLTFQYPGTTVPVLSDITLTIRQGMTLAIVGHTGAGKSTLASLLPRLYDVPPGSCKIDGHDLRRIPLQLLRRHIGFVTQETMLFSDTLAENITFGVDQAPQAAFQDAVRISQLNKDLDQFPDGWNTLVGERGLTLSGGQKQRVAISRAILRDPKILILDDSLSAVDTYTEEAIWNELEQVRRGRTTILISHRISTVHDADLIIVLENGHIVEQGRHEQLLAVQGAYYQLYQRQLLEQSLEEI
ncbi:ABC transporter ATP-binding protein [bacterium]|nr:ABC transporter ATP-binding protein [bacterium]